MGEEKPLGIEDFFPAWHSRQLLPFADGASRHWELEDGAGALHLFNGSSFEFCRIHCKECYIFGNISL